MYKLHLQECRKIRTPSKLFKFECCLKAHHYHVIYSSIEVIDRLIDTLKRDTIVTYKDKRSSHVVY